VVGQICSSPFGQAGRGKLKVVAQEMAGSGLLATAVTVRGEKEPLILPAPGSEEWKKLFVPFAKALRQHLKEKGFEKLYWGWFHDWASGAQVLAAPLAEELPDVGWARSSHYGSQRRAFSKDCKAEVTLDMRIRAWTEPFNSKTHEPVSHRGWARPGNVLFPRYASSIQHIGYFEWPMALHWLTENCLVNGAAGVGRLGADFWPSRPIPYNYFSPAMTDPYLLPPGPDGADASQRFEALREGVQEAEARIWLEKNGKDAQEPAKTVLADRIRVIATLDVSHTSPINSYFVGWQERSWDLYAAAAAASGGKAPGAQEKAAFFAAGAGK
jgi:hypothetical protein